MTKKEQAYIESLLTRAALRETADVLPDVPPPQSSSELSKGWMFAGAQSDWPRVDVACSSAVYHSFGRTDKTDSQGGRSLYSTKLLALKAMRRAVENSCMGRLRRIDRMIEQEEQ